MGSKMFVIVTNYKAGEKARPFGHPEGACNTVIGTRWMHHSHRGDITIGPEESGLRITVDADNELAIPAWGGFGRLSKKEAKRLGGDFGIWFSS